MPLGTQGGLNIPMGYSDLALAKRGVWDSDLKEEWWSSQSRRFEGLPADRVEAERAAYGQRVAGEWARANWRKLPGLAYDKVRNLWVDGFPGRFGLPLAACSLAAIPWSFRKRRECLIFWALLAINSLAVAATFGAGFRFLVPVLPPLLVLVGLGLWRMGAGIRRILRPRGIAPAL